MVLVQLQEAVNAWYELIINYIQQEVDASTSKRSAAVDLPISLQDIATARSTAFDITSALRKRSGILSLLIRESF